MKDKMKIYADIVLKTCLKIEKNQPLLISCSTERLDFLRIVAEKAYELGVVDIYFDLSDPILKHDALKNLKVEELKKMPMFNKKVWSDYAKRNAAFLMLVSENPGLNNDIDPKKLNDMTLHIYKTRGYFNEGRNASKIPWCIAGVPSESWAKLVFPKAKDPLKKLWDTIFKVCEIDKNCENTWNNKINRINETAELLNKYNFRYLKYTNSLGTDLEIELPPNHVWTSGCEILQNGKEVLVNFPTEEVFTSPKYNSVNGIVYSSKPLIYQNNVIDKFNIRFENGKAVDVHADKGEKALKSLIKSTPNSDFLGEVALVPCNSPISNLNIVFYETLYDENASCHLALGDSFPECIKNGTKLSKSELKKLGLNSCDNHVDFMVGTADLDIIGITYDNKKVQIFKNGNFTEEFKK